MAYHSAKLSIHTIAVDGKTIPRDVFYSAPFKLMNFFETASGGIEYMVMNASAGIMAHDRYEIEICAGENSALTLLPQSFEKIHKMDFGEATRKSAITIEKNAFFKYLALPTIPFAASAFRANTRIQLADMSSRLLYGEIVSCGRHLRKERFSYRHYKSCVDIILNEKMVCRDHSVFVPEQMLMESIGLFEHYAYLANLFIYGFVLSESVLEAIKRICEDEQAEAGITPLLGGGYLIRLLNNHSEKLIELFSKITSYVAGEYQ